MTPPQAISVHNLGETVDSILTAACPADGPGAAVIVVRDGQVLLRQGYGLANLELQVSVGPNMVFRLGSITKQFTAIAIMMLLEEGKLALDDPLTTLLPEYPAPGHVVTVEHLLTHTSGITSYTSLPQWAPLWRHDMTLPALIDLFKDLPLEFTPGERYAYSNSGYILLGAIIERHSGVSYEQFLRERIFVPLGMDHTDYDHTERIVAGRASGYQKGKDGLENAPYVSMTHPYAAGALMSSVDDLALWDAALYTERLVRQTTLQRAFTPYRLANGVSTGYGYGWGITSYESHPIIEHAGGIHGFLSDAKRLPDDRLYVAVLMNSLLGNPPPNFLAMQIAAAALGMPYQQPVAVSLEPALLQRYEGVYQDQDGDRQERTVRRQDDHLVLASAQGGEVDLFPLSDEAFILKHSFARVNFHLDAAGMVQSLERRDRGSPPQLARRVEKPLPPVR